MCFFCVFFCNLLGLDLLKPSGKSEGLGLGSPRSRSGPRIGTCGHQPRCLAFCWRVFSVDEFHRSLLGPGVRLDVRVIVTIVHTVLGCFQKIGMFLPKMDGENHGQPGH